MIQEINRHSPDIQNLQLNNTTYKYIKVRENERIYFPNAVVLMCGLKVGNYIHFLNEGNEWMFYSNDNKDGFKIVITGDKLLQICSYPLSRMILKSCSYQFKHTFYVRQTKIIHDNCPVFKLQAY